MSDVGSRGVLRVGDRIRWEGRVHVVSGLSGLLVRLAVEDDMSTETVVALARLQSDADFSVLRGGGAPTATLSGLGLLDTVPAEHLDRARWWEQHLQELETGQRSDGSAPRACYDPQLTTIEQRELAKLAELTAVGVQVGRRTLQRYRGAYAAQGLWGLVDHRRTRATRPTGRCDPRVVAAIVEAMGEQTDLSTGTRTRLRRRAQALLDAEHGPGVISLPPSSTFYRLLRSVESGRHTFGAATTRRSLANRPTGPFGTVLAARPGELMQIDTTPLDVLALLEDGVTGRVELTILVDLATRTICAGLLRPHGTKAVDAAVLLARTLVPEPMRPGWSPALAMRASRLPHSELAAVDARLHAAAAKPVIAPETIVCDRGAVFVSETFLAACARLGISLQPAHPHTPTDKGVVERTFASINTLFCQYVAGYTGRDTSRRGRDVEGRTVWSLAELQDLFDQWVLAGWQTRPHDGLRHPQLPGAALSPNEAYAAQVAAAGYLPLALSAGDYLELLPVHWRTVTATGIQVGSLTYDCAALNPLRGQSSSHRGRRGRWPVHVDPYDLGQVWIRQPDAPLDTTDTGSGSVAGWLEVPWIHRGRTPAPFADFTLRHVRRVLAARVDDGGGQLSVAEALNALLDQASTPPAADRPARRIAAKTRSAGPGSVTAVAVPALRVAGTQEPGTEEPDIETPTAVLDEPADEPLAAVVPFGVFDAHAEARRYW